MFNILIIDDEPWSRQVVRALGEWERLEMNVIGEAEDGTEGLRRIEELKPHIVITDMRMPGLDGVGLLKAMNERYPALKIIVMSGYDDFIYLKQAIRSRAVEYLLKPIDQGELNAALAECAQELRQVNKGAGPSWRTPFIFADAATLEQYLAYRQRVYGYLLELNKQAVLETLSRLEELLHSSSANREEGNILSKVGHDFMLMLEEFTTENEVDFNSLWSDRNVARNASVDWGSVSEAFHDIKKLYEEAVDAIEANRRNRLRLDIAEVQSHIDRHYQDQISLDTVAQRFFVSKEHLSRVFKSQQGENLSDYIIRKRMEKARELIVEQKMAIKHVAQLTGYADVAYFYRVFKKFFGQTPGDLRKED
ncbi:response regulator [Cohnella silvisoli]|uniref:Response regulator n=1 Tax=Cohnella silvisoli TaxID=2873699 RepID=A0ABV1KX37_9BACL|nr:response regulator [Cohnella silvisoli]MCD9023864.1 response regulator [Cohnella silvisoli]